MPRRTAAAGGHRCWAVTQRPGDGDQAWPPLMPVGAALRVAPPVRPIRAVAARTRTADLTLADERAPALDGRDLPLACQHLDRPACRRCGYPVLPRQCGHGWQRFAREPLPGVDAFPQGIGHRKIWRSRSLRHTTMITAGGLVVSAASY